MKTVIVNDITEETMHNAGEIIKKGGIVAFPTETVYGLGANAYNEDAVKKIYAAKGRPSDNPLIVHIADACDAEKIAREIPETARKIFDAFSPGPVTVIMKKQPDLPDIVTAGLDTVGVRIPSNETARKFIKASGVPIAAPSANLSGKPSPTSAEHVISDMDGRCDAIICGENSTVGVESTIIDVTGEIPVILRPGGVTLEEVITVCGACTVDANVLKSAANDKQPKCPGMKYKHYAPNAEVAVIEGAEAATVKKISELVKIKQTEGKKVGVLAASEDSFGADMYIYSGKNNAELAKKLFAALREFDKNGIETVFVQLSIQDEMLLTVKNRVYRSAGHHVIYV